MTNLCRACLSLVKSLEYSLFKNVSPYLFWFCTSIEVSKDETLPTTLCNNCFKVLSDYAAFKQKCIDSQNYFLQLKNIKPDEKCIKSIEENSIEKQINDNDSKLSENVNIHNNSDNKIKDKHDNENSDNEFNCDEEPYESISEKQNTEFKHPIRCDICSKIFTTSRNYNKHKLTHKKIAEPRKRFTCTPCNKTFLTVSGYRRHQINCHSWVKLSTVKCQICGKITKSRETLKAHEKLHEIRNIYVCHVCGKPCASSCILKVHLEIHKENRERQYTCEHCGKKFYTKTNLTSHVSKCHSDKRYICQICNYPFTDKYNLSKHMLIHEGIKLFKCEVCAKSYSTRSTLVEHQRIHSGERPYNCVYCPKSFLSKRRLTDHHRIHTGERLHKCSVCEQSFTQRGTLKRHMKVHDRTVLGV